VLGGGTDGDTKAVAVMLVFKEDVVVAAIL
jgi:hypothetical protein